MSKPRMSVTFVGEGPVARKNLDCSECGAEYTVTSKESDDPSYCPFCGDPGTNYVSDDEDDDEDDESDVDDDWDVDEPDDY